MAQRGKRTRPQERGGDDGDAQQEEHPDVDAKQERNADQLSAVDRNIHVLNKVLKQRSEQVKQEMDKLPPGKRPKGTQAYEVNAIQYMFDPYSFTQTVENMFHFSFLVKNGGARIAARPDGPKVASISRSVKKEPRQAIVSLTMQDWRDLCRAYNVHKPDVPHRTGSKQVHHFKEPSRVYPSNPNTSNNVTAAASNEVSAEMGGESADTSNGSSAETNKEATVEKMDATESEKTTEPSYEDLELLMAKMVHEVDLQTTSFKAFFELLSKELGGIDLTSKKGFIKNTLSDIIISMEGDGDHVNSDDNEERYVQPKKRKKTNDGVALAVSISPEVSVEANHDDYVETIKKHDNDEDVQPEKRRKTDSGGELTALMEGSPEESEEAKYAETINDNYWETIDDDEYGGTINFEESFDQSTPGFDGLDKLAAEIVGLDMSRISGEASTVGADHVESVPAQNGVGSSVEITTTTNSNTPGSAQTNKLCPQTTGFSRLPVCAETNDTESGERLNGDRSPVKSSTATQGGTYDYKYSSLTARLARVKRKRRNR
jgi:hypothetical protein